MNFKKKIISVIGLSFLGVFAIAASLIELPKFNKLVKTDADDTYTLILNKGIDTDGNDYGEVTNSNGTTFGFKLSNYTKGSSTLGTLSTTGQILNYTAFNSITNISVTTTSSSNLDVYYGWKQYETSEIEYCDDSSLHITSSGTHSINLAAISPSYFMIEANSPADITSVSITYKCTPSTSINSFTFKIERPTVGGNPANTINDDNYVWICTNVIDTTVWSNYCMNRNEDDSWTYTFDNVAVRDGGYTYTIVVCNSDTTISWDYTADDCDKIGFGLGAGQTELNIGVINFANQPKVVSTTYTLNLTIITSGTPGSFGNIQFVDNYTNSTSSYNWNQYISYSWNSSFTYSKSNLDTEQTLYFRIYMWSDNKNIYVGSTGGTNFEIHPTGEETINATVEFTYENAAQIVGTCTVEGSEGGDIYFPSQITSVYGSPITIEPSFSGSTESFTASYSGENIRIDNNNTIVGLKAGTVTKVTLTSYSGATCSFNVTVSNSTYTANWTRDKLQKNSQTVADYEGWFESTEISEISSMGEDFFNGVDVSSAKALYDNGSKYFNEEGVEQSLFYILKDHGVNWVRLKLWVDPYMYNSSTPYGGGISDLANTKWAAYEAKAAGLKVLLDFHYSDYWAHPGQQVLPKSWNSVCTSKSALCSKIKSYTTETLNLFKASGCLPDMVQLGNEISSGIFLQQYTGTEETFSSSKPSYLVNTSAFNYGTSTYSQYTDYIKAGCEGVNAVDSSIKKVIHWAKGGGNFSASSIVSFFSYMPSSYYDYAGISIYPYHCFDSVSSMESAFQTIKNGLSKPWFIAETSYPFSGDGYVYEDSTQVTQLSISNGTSGLKGITSSYAFTGEGQAKFIHDFTNAVVSNNGLGIFYWEPAWLPNINVEAEGPGSGCSWSNQGFFSFDGKVIANIDVFKQMSAYIN